MAFEFPLPMIMALSAASLWLVVDGIALSLGARWAYRTGLRLPWKAEVLPMAMPRQPLNMSDELDRDHSFETPDRCAASYLGRDTIGLLYWGVGFGTRNSLNIKILRAIGVVLSGIMEIERGPSQTVLRWRPVLRLPPLLLLATMLWMMTTMSEGLEPFNLALILWGLMYLGALLWTWFKLPKLYDAVSNQLVEQARRASER